MGDVGIESTLVLDGLAVSKVRFYSTLNSDVGKRVEITDKFNPLNVFTGTFDESLNLLYDLPAFTSYRVKMYGLDGETVESDQSFMLKGYDYLEKNVGLNKNSFAGIKAIVDQGLESTMLEVGHTWYEDDGANSAEVSVPWQILAIDYQPETEGYNHSVMIGRKRATDATSNWTDIYNNLVAIQTYYDSLPSKIKDTLTTRNFKVCHWNFDGSIKQRYEKNISSKVWTCDPAQFIPRGTTTDNFVSGEYGYYSQFPAYADSNNRLILSPSVERGSYVNVWLPSSIDIKNYTRPVHVRGQNGELTYTTDVTLQMNLLPHMMIASDPIAQNS